MKNENKLIGVVAAGGNSSRMGNDKSQLIYRTLPIEIEIANMMHPVCNEVVLSKNHSQALNIYGIEVMYDDAALSNHGPASSLLTAAKRFPEASILLLGCDYPMFDASMLQRLISARNPFSEIVCYYHPINGFAEPLLAIYESKILNNLYSKLEACHFSLQRLLKQSATLNLIPNKLDGLQSIDTAEQFLNIENKLKHEH